MRSTSAEAPRGKTIDAQGLGDRSHVADAAGDVAVDEPGRPPVTGPVVGDEPDALASRVLDVRRVEQAGARGAVVDEDRAADRIPIVGDVERAAVRSRD